MSKFSKGEWHIESEYFICNDDDVIAAVSYPHREFENFERVPEGRTKQAANCRLIAAAPEMYGIIYNICRVHKARQKFSKNEDMLFMMDLTEKTVISQAEALLAIIDNEEVKQ